MCDCNKIDGFAKALQTAKKIEDKTGIKQAVYINKANGLPTIGAVNTVKNLDGVCCYYLSDGKEVLVPVKEASKTYKKKISKEENTEKVDE